MLEILLEVAKEIGVGIGLGIGFGIVMVLFSNKKTKTGVKTLIFLLLSETVAGLLCWLSWSTYRSGNTVGGIVLLSVCVMLAIVFLLGAVYGHRKEWKQNTD